MISKYVMTPVTRDALRYFLFYMPNDKGAEFSKRIKKLMNFHCNEDIMEYVNYLNDIPWLKERL